MSYLLQAFDNNALFVISLKREKNIATASEFIPVKSQKTQENNNNSGNCNVSCFK